MCRLDRTLRNRLAAASRSLRLFIRNSGRRGDCDGEESRKFGEFPSVPDRPSFPRPVLLRRAKLLRPDKTQRAVRTNPVVVAPPSLNATPGDDGLIQDFVFSGAIIRRWETSASCGPVFRPDQAKRTHRSVLSVQVREARRTPAGRGCAAEHFAERMTAHGLGSIHFRRRRGHQVLLQCLTPRKLDLLRIPFQASQVVKAGLNPAFVIG